MEDGFGEGVEGTDGLHFGDRFAVVVWLGVGIWYGGLTDHGARQGFYRYFSRPSI